MFNRRRTYLIEGLKSMLILLLTLSAIMLAVHVFLPAGTGSTSGTLDLLLSAQAPLRSTGVARPVRMAVMNTSGRYGVQYDDQAVDDLFDDLGDLLGESLSSVSTVEPVGRDVWESALSAQGVYYDFPGIVSLSMLSAWLGEEESAMDANVTCLLLTQGESPSAVYLYYTDGDDGRCYAGKTSVQFRQRLDSYTPNGAVFAFQMPDRYSGLSPDTMILPDVPAPAVCKAAAGVNIQDGSARDELMSALSVAPQPNSVYPAADGWNIRDGEDSFRLTNDGTVYFHGGEHSDRYPISPEATRTELMEFTGEWVRRMISPYCGDAHIYLSDVAQTGSRWTLTYYYALSGADVHLGQEGWCAQFTIQNGQIREYILKLRRYEATDQTAVLLPEYQAMYAMEAMNAEGRQLLLRYYDNGGSTLSPTWIAR